MGESQVASRLQDEGSPKLPGIALDADLARPRSARAQRISEQTPREQRLGPATQAGSAFVRPINGGTSAMTWS